MEQNVYLFHMEVIELQRQEFVCDTVKERKGSTEETVMKIHNDTEMTRKWMMGVNSGYICKPELLTAAVKQGGVKSSSVHNV